MHSTMTTEAIGTVDGIRKVTITTLRINNEVVSFSVFDGVKAREINSPLQTDMLIELEKYEGLKWSVTQKQIVQPKLINELIGIF